MPKATVTEMLEKFGPCVYLPWRYAGDIRPDFLLDTGPILKDLESNISHHHEDRDYAEWLYWQSLGPTPLVTFTKMYDSVLGLTDYLLAAHNLMRMVMVDCCEVTDAYQQKLRKKAEYAFPGEWHAYAPRRSSGDNQPWPDSPYAGRLYGPEGSGYMGTGHLAWIYTPPEWGFKPKLMRDYLVFLEPMRFMHFWGIDR